MTDNQREDDRIENSLFAGYHRFGENKWDNLYKRGVEPYGSFEVFYSDHAVPHAGRKLGDRLVLAGRLPGLLAGWRAQWPLRDGTQGVRQRAGGCMSMFQTRHYDTIAKVLANTSPHWMEQISAWEETRDALADMFQKDNVNFKRGKFLEACDAQVQARKALERKFK